MLKSFRLLHTACNLCRRIVNSLYAALKFSFFFFLLQYDWLMGQIHEKDVSRYFTTVSGEPCVMTISLTKKRVLSVACMDLGRL